MSQTMKNSGKLYIVATPIGNMEDMSFRAVRILKEVDAIAAEDTRHTSRLLSFYQIETKLISCHEHNETERIPYLTARMESGEDVALVSDAGTPSISDPGYRLARAVIEKGIKVIPIPGPSAAITALSASGMPSDSFIFIGFSNKKSGKRAQELEALKDQPRTLIFYESPKRVIKFIEEIICIMGDRHAVLSREITKIHEEFIRGNLSEILSILKKRDSVKGECTLLVSGASQEIKISPDMLKEEIRTAIKDENVKISELSKKLAKKYKLSRKIIYSEALNLKREE